MNNVYVKGRRWPVAGQWNELTPRQLLRVVHVLFRPLGQADLETRLVAILMQTYRLSRPRLAWQLIRMPLTELIECRPLVHFLLEQKAQLTRQLLPRVRARWWLRPWYGPGDYLQGLTFSEWIDAEAAVFRFRQTQRPEHLNQLVAVLYRPGRRQPDASTGDRRPVYAQHEVATRAQLAGQLPLDVRRAILLYYDSCRHFYIEQFPEVFSGGGEEDAPAATEQNPAPAYLRILREMAGSPDKFDVMGRQPIGNILFDLAERIKQAEKATTPSHE